MKEYGFEKLEVWVASKALTVKIYKITSKFPKEEQFGLIGQLRRAALSIGSNIAEGSGRTSKKDFAHFLQIAYSSNLEVLQQLIIAQELKYISPNELESMRETIDLISMKLGALRKSLLSPKL